MERVSSSSFCFSLSTVEWIVQYGSHFINMFLIHRESTNVSIFYGEITIVGFKPLMGTLWMEMKVKRKKGAVEKIAAIGKPNTEKRLKDWGRGNQPAGHLKNWRQVKIRSTCIVRTWSHENKVLIQRYVSA